MSDNRKKSFVLYFDNYDSIRDLPVEQQGYLFSALFQMAMKEVEHPGSAAKVLEGFPEMSPSARMAYSFIAKVIQRDTEKWKEKHERYKKSAEDRWEKSRDGGQASSQPDPELPKYVKPFSKAYDRRKQDSVQEILEDALKYV